MKNEIKKEIRVRNIKPETHQAILELAEIHGLSVQNFMQTTLTQLVRESKKIGLLK